jgi:hypothetical protein
VAWFAADNAHPAQPTFSTEKTDIVADALTEALTELETLMAQKTEDRITLAIERVGNRLILAFLAIAGLVVAIFAKFH